MTNNEIAIAAGVVTIVLIGGSLLVRTLYRFKKDWDKSRHWLGK